MKCRFCGKDLQALATGLVTNYGLKCEAAPNKKHVALTDGINCVYCGRKLQTRGRSLVTVYGERCQPSPTEKHTLQ